MTTDQVLKLDSIQSGSDLTWRRYSYDAGHPKCLCSACGILVKDSESFLESDKYFDSAGKSLEEQVADNFHIRIFRGSGKKMTEAVLHHACFMYLNAKGIIG
jgi:hypothetical protein